MSLQERYFTTYNRDGVEHRFSIWQEGYGGGSSRLVSAGDFFRADIEELDFRDLFRKPAQTRELEYTVKIRTASQLSFFETLAGAEQDDYQLRYEKDSSTECIVWMQSDMIEVPTGPLPKNITLRGKDLTYLKGQQYSLTQGRITLIALLADLLSNTDLSLQLKTIPSITNANITDPGDWLNQISGEKRRIREYADTADESDVTVDVYDALQIICRNFGLILRQEGGVWYLRNPTALANDPVTIYTYDTSGSQLSSASVDLDKEVSDANSLYMLPKQGTVRYNAGLKRVESTFAHESQTQVQNIPDTVTVTEVEASEDYTPIPFYNSDGSQTFVFRCGVEADSTGDETSITALIEFRVGASGNYYYLEQTDTGLNWTTTQTDYEIDLTGFNVNPNQPGIDDGDDTGDSAGVWFNNRVSFETPSIPADADGDIQVTFKGAQDQVPNVVPETRYFNIEFNLKNPTVAANSRSLEYYITNSRNFSSVYDFGETWFGDGPASYSDSALTYQSGGKDVPTNDDWRRAGGSAERKFHLMMMREMLDLHRTATEVIQAELWGDFETWGIINYDSERYFILGGEYNGKRGRWNVYLLKINVIADDDSIGVIIDGGGGGGGSGGGSGGGGEDPNAIAELTDDVSSTTATTLPVNVYAGKAIESGKDYYIYHLQKKQPTSFTALEDLDSGDATLDIEEQVVVAPSGSKIYKEEGQKETERVIQVEQQTATESARASLSLSVKNERQATSLGTTVNQVSGTVTSIALENIPFEVKVEDGDVLTILSTEDSDEGNSEEITVDGNQTLTAGTGTLTIESIALSNTYPAGSAVFEPAVGLTSRISLVSEVTTSNSSSIASLETDVSALESTLVLKAEVTSGEITKLAFIQLDASIAGGSAITLAADQIKIDGTTTFTAGYDPSQRADSQDFAGDGASFSDTPTNFPSTRSDGSALKAGDLAFDTSFGRKPYRYNGTSWDRAYTIIDGGDIIAGTVTANQIDVDDLFAENITIGTNGVIQANFDGTISSGAITADGTTGWAIDYTGYAVLNDATIRSGNIIDPNFSGNAVGLINIVSTFANLPATGEEDGDTYYVEDEPGGLYVWRSADSEWKDTRDGQFLLANTVVASKINVATLSAITADIGAANITDTLTMGASGAITNSSGDYTLDADGLALDIGTASAQSIEWYDGATRNAFVNTTAAGVLQLAGWDGSQVNLGITIGDNVETSLDTVLAIDTGDVRLGSASNPIPTSAAGALARQIYRTGNYLRIEASQAPLELPIYSNATRPSATSADTGQIIFNTDTDSPQYVDGAGNWDTL